MFSNFSIVNNHYIAYNITTTVAREKISIDLDFIIT